MNVPAVADIRETEPAVLKAFLTESGEKDFRYRQIRDWIWKKSVQSFEDMTDLPQKLRDLLQENFAFYPLLIAGSETSADGTVKYLFRLHDAHHIESVLIPEGDRVTACISSQAGCPLRCAFCATGLHGFQRNLQAAEIYDQVAFLMKEVLKKNLRLTNVVMMGMGEPLLNYDAVKKAISLISGSDGLGFSASRITVSTAGIPEGIRKMADESWKTGLAVSLHSAIAEKRVRLMPVSNRFSLKELKDALNYYCRVSGEAATLEYLMLSGINDGDEDARALLDFSKGLKIKINLIPFNAVGNTLFLASSREKMLEFQKKLRSIGLHVFIRKSRGGDIRAACGQLATDHQTAS